MGTVNTLKTYNSLNALIAGEGQGPAVEAAAYTLQNSGGPIRFMKLATSVAGAVSALAKSGAGPAITIAGTPNDDYQVYLVIPSGGGGILGTGKFQYSLDGGLTLSEVQVIPAGGTYAIPNSGMTLTFPAGTYVALETYTGTGTAPMWNASDLGTGITALLADVTTTWRFLVCCGRIATGAAAATIAAALQSHMNSFAAQFRYRRAIVDSGDEAAAAAVITAWTSTAADRVAPAFRGFTRASGKPFPGFAYVKSRVVDALAFQASRVLPSTDLGRVASGALPGVLSIEHDEFLLGPTLDDAKISTLRTIPGNTGYFITNGRLKAGVGSDFQYWQYGILMDIACETVYARQAQFLNAGYRRNPNGTILEADASRLEGLVLADLGAALLQPRNEEGTQGHVSGLRYAIDLSNTIPNSVISEVAIQPLNYAKFITTRLGYVSSLPAAA
ncbi:MAG: hypothetical protein H0U56_15635 [Methylibium sp.]|nr:hypothetical protein [Methylibium sp.]